MFFQEFWSILAAEKLVMTWYIEKLCDELQVISERVFLDQPKEYDLLWNCPPGTTKSSVLSIAWQPWVWTRMPSARFITGSHSEKLALDLSRKSRDIVTSDKYQRLFPEVKLREDQNAKGYWVNSAGGIRYAVGVGGAVIGMHAHFLGIDDPIDPQGALSDLELATANIWTTETLSRRKVHVMLTPTAMIMQRLHQDDPTGNWLARGTRNRHFVIPCDTTWDIKPESLRENYIDGLMDPQRYPQQALDDARKELGEAGYAGQLGQNPVPRGGAKFKIDRILYMDRLPAKWKKGPVRYWDKAACLIACTLVDTLNGRMFIENVRAGDQVLTRDGYCEVEWAGVTKEVDELVTVLYTDGSAVTGTPDHLVWTENRGWIPLVAASAYDYNVGTVQRLYSGESSWQDVDRSARRPQKYRNSMEFDFDDRSESDTSRRIYTIGRQSVVGQNQFTEPCGNTFVVKSPMVMMFTTLTTTQAITRLTILSASHTATICESIGESGRLEKVEEWLRVWLRGQRQNGVNEYSRRMERERERICPYESLNVRIASLFTPADRRIPDPVIALMSVGSKHTRKLPVYDLTVRKNHEFFANGTLVHNSAKSGCFTVGTKESLDEDSKLWITDVIRGQWDSGTREKIIVETAKADGKSTRVVVEQEPGSGGKESAEATVRRLTNLGFRCTLDKVTGDKELRADVLSQKVNLGDVIILKAPWNKEFIEELRFFPVSKYKDQVDSASGAASALIQPRLRVGGF